MGIRCKCLECVSNISGYCRNDIIEIDENGECSYRLEATNTNAVSVVESSRSLFKEVNNPIGFYHDKEEL